MYLCPEFEKSGSCPKGKYCPYPHKSVAKKKERARKRPAPADETRATAGAPSAARSDRRKRYYEMGDTQTVTVELGSKLESVQVSNEGDSADPNVGTSELFEQDDDRKRALQNSQCSCDGQIDASSDLGPENEEPEAKYPKLGILPGYIPLG
jgi:hypothetical protein